MPEIYPLNPVITSNAAFASLYDGHPRSRYLVSECLTPSEAAKLLDEGATFSTVVFLGGEGEELAGRLASDEDPQAQKFARLERVDPPAIDEEAVKQVHRLLNSHGARAFFQNLYSEVRVNEPSPLHGASVFFQIDLETFEVVQEGFLRRQVGNKTLYTSSGLAHLDRIEQLADSEYGQAVEVDRDARTVSFGRDFLGHFPLSYGCAKRRLYVSDSFRRICDALRDAGVALTLSEEALALYFSYGFVPQGLSTFREIVNCEATGFYTWSKGSVRRTRQFEPVEVDENAPVQDLGEAIEREVAKYAAQAPEIDVWCSGGLDSSIMAVRFNSEGRRAELLTLAYGKDIHEQFGDGERRFARIVARACGTRVREVDLSARKFEEIHETSILNHDTPVIDWPVPPKYALAEASRPLVITGEGGDNFFGGPKNVKVLYGHDRDPSISPGWLYAVAHERLASKLRLIFKKGDELTDYVRGYGEKLLAAYPGSLLRKLFYLNSLEKPASMIFAQSYFPSRLYGLTIRHPMAALDVYRQAFRLADRKKFVYPANKIALMELYGAQLPESIARRSKSGTVLPLRHYMQKFSRPKLDFDALAATGMIRPKLLDELRDPRVRGEGVMLSYALVTLNLWLNQRKDTPSVRSQASHRGRGEHSRGGIAARTASTGAEPQRELNST